MLQKYIMKRKKFKPENRNKCIKYAMNYRDLTEDEAIAEVDSTVDRLDITYKEYWSESMYALLSKDQDEKAVYLKKLKEECRNQEKQAILSTMKKTGWSEKRAQKEMKRVKTELGLDFVDYDSYNFALTPVAEQKEKYESIKDELGKKKEIQKKRNLCVWRTMWIREISFESAVKEVENTIAKLGIDYATYIKFRLNRYTEEDKEYVYHTAKEYKDKKQRLNQENIAKLAKERNWEVQYIKDMIQEYEKAYGCKTDEFFAYKLYDMDKEQIGKMFFMSYMKNFKERYNKNSLLTRLFMSKQSTNQFLKDYIPRKWCINRNITFEEFEKLFDGEAGIVYKPNYGFQARGVQVIYFNGDMRGVYDKVMSFAIGVVEEIIKQHPDMKKLSPESVNCLRIVSVSSKNGTVLPDGTKSDIAYVSLKIGRNGNIVDNVIAGGMVANVDIETGIVVTHGINHDLQVIENHPDTGTPIKGFKIPYFKEALELVHRVIKEKELSGLIGWDMAIGENGPEIVEPNFGPAASLLQDPYYPTGEGMKYRMEKYFW